MKKLFIALLILPFVSLGQQLSYDEYMANVLLHHPVAKRANLEREYAEIAQLKALGELDPKIYASHKGKGYKNKEYYNLTTAEMKIPLRKGIQLKAGYDRTSGEYYNPQNKTDQWGVWQAGVEVDVLRGLLVNERTTALELANLYDDKTEIERGILINELLYNASKQYLEWSANYQAVEMLNKNIELAKQYVSNTENLVQLGDKPQIDVLEASTNVTTLEATANELYANYVQSKWLANQYLWQGNARVELLENTTPETDFDILVAQKQNLQNLLLQEKELKLEQYRIEQNLAREQLKPKLQLGYFPLLSTKNTPLPTEGAQLYNVKYGASFSMPLFRRKAKSEVAKLDIKQRQTELELTNKRNELKIKQEALLAKLEAYQRQQKSTEKLLTQTKELLLGETTKFNYGESSVFILNKRQEKVIATELKLIKIEQKINKTKLEYLYYTNGFLLMN